MIGEGPKSESTGICGWESIAEERALIDLARRYVPEKDGVIVELGVEYGRSTAQFAHATALKQNVQIFSVDIFPDDHHLAKQYGGLESVWYSNLYDFGIQNWHNIIIKPIRGKSYEIGANWSHGAIDLLFIDAAHDYISVKSDIQVWVNFVRPGGIVIFHDYWKNENSHPVHLEVKRAVDEWQAQIDNKWERHDAPDSLVYFVRPALAESEAVNIADGALPTGATISKLTGVPGWLTDEEERKLVSVAKLFVPDTGVIVELGGGIGRSAAAFGLACKNKKRAVICTVDLFDDGAFSKRLPFNQLEAWYKNITQAMTSKNISHSFNGNISPIFNYLKQNSQHNNPNWNNPIDLLFIDADHDADSVTADIKAWSKYVKPGGLMVFHDYHRGDYKDVFHGVVTAVNAWKATSSDEWQEIELVGSLVGFKRKDKPGEFSETVERGTSADTPDAKAKPAAKKKSATTTRKRTAKGVKK